MRKQAQDQHQVASEISVRKCWKREGGRERRERERERERERGERKGLKYER